MPSDVNGCCEARHPRAGVLVLEDGTHSHPKTRLHMLTAAFFVIAPNEKRRRGPAAGE